MLVGPRHCCPGSPSGSSTHPMIIMIITMNIIIIKPNNHNANNNNRHNTNGYLLLVVKPRNCCPCSPSGSSTPRLWRGDAPPRVLLALINNMSSRTLVLLVLTILY